MIPNQSWDSVVGAWASVESDPSEQWDLSTFLQKDNLRLRFSEGSSLIQSFSTRTDTLRVKGTEQPSKLVSYSTVLDNLLVRISESAYVVGAVHASDTLRIGITEVPSTLLSQVVCIDSLWVGLAESFEISVDIQMNDVLLIRVLEETESEVQSDLADSLQVVLGEAAQAIVLIGIDSGFELGFDELRVAVVEDRVICVVDWPDDVELPTGTWVKVAALNVPWIKEPPIGIAWAKRKPLTPKDEGCFSE